MDLLINVYRFKSEKEKSRDISLFQELNSFVVNFFKEEDRVAEKLIKIFNKEHLRTSTENLWISNESKYGDFKNGVIIYNNSNIKNKGFCPEKNTLISKLLDSNSEEIIVENHPIIISTDKTVSYTPFGFNSGSLYYANLAKNPYNIALSMGEERAEKIAEFSKMYKVNPFLVPFMNEDLNGEIKITTTTVISGSPSRRGLCIYGKSMGKTENAYSIGKNKFIQ